MNKLNPKTVKLAASNYLPRILSIAVLVSTIFMGISDAGIGRSGIASGSITAFGSIFVNNRELFIDDAMVTIDGQPGSGASLKLGQVVTVRGDFFDTESPAGDILRAGDATEVEFKDNVEGLISEIYADENQLFVLGQSILIGPDTILALLSGPGSLEDLEIGDQIEVSGFDTADGEVLASRIEQKTPSGLNEVTGTVNDLDSRTFTFNALTVDYSNATLINFPSGRVSEGDVAEAQGSYFGENGELLALTLEFREGITADEDEFGEVEGLITNFVSAGEFSIGNLRVSTDQYTLFVGGGAANLAADTSVEAQGQFDDDGILVAEQVTIRGTRTRIEGPVDSASASELVIFQIPIGTNADAALPDTILKDKSALHLDPFHLTDFSEGDFAEIRSFKNPTFGDPVIAKLINRVKAESDVRLQGFVDSFNAQFFQMYGVTVYIDDETDFSNAEDEKISADDFFGAVSAGTFVVVHGDVVVHGNPVTDTGIIATKVELALDD